MLSSYLVAFAAVLRGNGIDVPSGNLLDAARALSVVDVVQQEDVRLALRATLVARQVHLAKFDELFDQFWRGAAIVPGDTVAGSTPATSPPGRALGNSTSTSRVLNVTRAGVDHPEATAGAADVLTTKDFAEYTLDDIHRARMLVRRLAPKLATEPGRRTEERSRGDRLDLRRSLRHAGRYGGEVLDLRWQRRRVRRTRIVLLCDVSGSMDRYAYHLIAFIHALQDETDRVSTFVFSTQLQEVTRLLAHRPLDDALAQIADHVRLWGAGTSIGGALSTFERDIARHRTNRRTVVVIISDGWERGEVETLRRGMAALKRRVYRLLWLNPLLGSPNYRPLARGMAAALPYVDHFLPAHNLASLERVAGTLVALSRC